jgi:uncharacterized membrane protein YdjX (TVP38/TMEM64 family)
VAHRARHLARRLLSRAHPRGTGGDPPSVAQDEEVTTAARGIWLRAALLVLLLAVGLVLALTMDVPDLSTVRSWVDGAGGAGGAAMVLAVALVLLAPVPRSAVSVLVGVVAGFGTGVVIAFVGGLLAALGAFGLSRTLGRSAAVRLAGPRLSRMDRIAAERGFVAVLTGRLVPMVPFVALSYGAGLTGVRFAPYVLATALGLVPSTVLQVGIGASAGFALEGGTVLTALPLAAVALVAVGVGGLLLWRRRAAVPPTVG